MRDRCWADLSPEEWLRTKFEQGFGMLPLTWLARRSLLTAIGPWDESLTLDDDGEYYDRRHVALNDSLQELLFQDDFL